MDDETVTAESLLIDPPDPEAILDPDEPEADEAADTQPDTGSGDESEIEAGAEADTAGEEDAEDSEAEEPDLAAADEGLDDEFELEIDGKTETVTLKELRDGYLRQSDYTRKRQEDAKLREALEADREQFGQAAQARLQRLDELAQLGSVALSRYQRTPEQWAQLREEDFEQYSREREELGELHNFMQHTAQERARHQQEALATRIPQEKRKLVEALSADGFDGWDTDEGFGREYAKLGPFLEQHFGITPEEWNGTVDHRSVRIAAWALKGWLHEQATRQAAPLKQLIRRKDPKPSLRPGTPRPPERPKAKAQKAAAERLKRRGGRFNRDTADVLLT